MLSDLPEVPSAIATFSALSAPCNLPFLHLLHLLSFYLFSCPSSLVDEFSRVVRQSIFSMLRSGYL